MVERELVMLEYLEVLEEVQVVEHQHHNQVELEIPHQLVLLKVNQEEQQEEHHQMHNQVVEVELVDLVDLVPLQLVV